MTFHPIASQVQRATNDLKGRPLKRAHRDWQRGVRYAKAGDWGRAEIAFSKAVQADPRDPVYLLNLARSQMKNERIPEAQRNAMEALALDPDSLIAREIVALCLKAQNRYEECAAVWQQVPAQVPLSGDYYKKLGEFLALAGQHQQALAALFEALGRDIGDTALHYSLGASFRALGRGYEAAECFRTALSLGLGAQRDLTVQGLLTFTERELCRWEHAAEDLAALRQMAAQLPADASSWANGFVHAVLVDEPHEHLSVARSCARFDAQGIAPFDPALPRPLGACLRVGFVSADFHQHATAHLMAEIFEQLDPTRFEVVLYSHGSDDRSAMRERLKRSRARFVDVAKEGDMTVAKRIRSDGIEVLVDLKGHTSENRLGIFAYRPAPVQVSFLGYPGTTGAEYIDYFIGDAIVSPLGDAAHYSEKLALMPRCYQPNDRQRPRPLPCTREEVGLPSDELVLCGFNQPFKLSPEVFDVWCRLLRRLPGSVLWLLQWNEHVPAQLRQQAEARGVDPNRLMFAPTVSPQQHMNRLAMADFFIDTWPCNGHTTVSDALWAGLPVVTYAGRTFASRVAASLLNAVGLNDLVTSNLADYEARVMDLATDASRRQVLRDYLVRARERSPLFDSAGFASDFGNLLRRMAERWSRGIPPEHLEDDGSLR